MSGRNGDAAVLGRVTQGHFAAENKVEVLSSEPVRHASFCPARRGVVGLKRPWWPTGADAAGRGPRLAAMAAPLPHFAPVHALAGVPPYSVAGLSGGPLVAPRRRPSQYVCVWPCQRGWWVAAAV